MNQVVASAPGKVIIAGEYAVLDGAPAICMAVNCRARVMISANRMDVHCVTAPGFLDMPLRAATFANCSEVPLLAAVWRQIPLNIDGYLNIEIDSSDFVSAGGEKFGIGSSAAVAVALTAAVGQLTDGIDIREQAYAAHNEFQGGGSGADVACSVAGGIIEYQQGDLQSQVLAWPAGLHYALLWSGRSSDTPAQLSKLAMVKPRASRQALATAAGTVASVWQGGRAAEVVAAVGEFTDSLQRFDVDHALGIFDAGHREMVAAAVSSDVVYKPCGAGGGDLGIAICEDEQALRAFVEAAKRQNFAPLPLSIEASGVEVEGSLG